MPAVPNQEENTESTEQVELEQEIGKETLSEERTVTETGEATQEETGKGADPESQSHEGRVTTSVSSDNSDSPLITLKQKSKAKKALKKRKATSHSVKGISRKTSRTAQGVSTGGTSQPLMSTTESGDKSVKPFSEKFLSSETKKRFDKFKGVEVIAERNVNVMDFRKHGICDLFEERQLTGTLTYACSFSKVLVREFYANLTPATEVSGDPMYHKAYVRGRFVEFSPGIINRLLGTPENLDQGLAAFPVGATLEDMEVALTGEYVAERNGKMCISDLKFESRVLQLVGKTNWLPTRRSDVIQDELAMLIFKLLRKEEINLGCIVYNHILSRAADLRVRFLLPYPCLIQSLIVRQSPEILADSEVTEVVQRPLTIETRIQQARLSKAQLSSRTFTQLLKHDRILLQVEQSLRRNVRLLSQIRAQQHALRAEFQRGESATASNKGKEKVVEEHSDGEDDDVRKNSEEEEERLSE
ncbi:PREDICTED: uncharacterized protein LOC104820182 [Tarenaya hassleriana]|uniref:uncharacterized protein LOC104820182 n=1 Tax=Tarenaya hassleriana TaxID=28532 RepID=UPI00053C99EB|nr:PREDICTED: uncharacterized protein LOC104820182 [Tarenaya hassleriana]